MGKCLSSAHASLNIFWTTPLSVRPAALDDKALLIGEDVY